ncbi:MAG: TM2 domain-containing protein [Fibromonadaceae bacterium]|nr:TM2 domain-containing protein [Fibromonadaceae bacterium]
MKQKSTALILAILFGVVGAHRFYVGKTGSAVAQLLTGGGLIVWVLIDIINIATGKFTDVNGNKLQ